MKERRKALAKAVERSVVPASLSGAIDGEDSLPQGDVDMEMADEEDIAVRVFRSVINGPGSQILQAVFDTSNKKKGKDSYRDEEFYMSHYHKDANTDKGYVSPCVPCVFPAELVIY